MVEVPLSSGEEDEANQDKTQHCFVHQMPKVCYF